MRYERMENLPSLGNGTQTLAQDGIIIPLSVSSSPLVFAVPSLSLPGSELSPQPFVSLSLALFTILSPGLHSQTMHSTPKDQLTRQTTPHTARIFCKVYCEVCLSGDLHTAPHPPPGANDFHFGQSCPISAYLCVSVGS